MIKKILLFAVLLITGLSNAQNTNNSNLYYTIRSTLSANADTMHIVRGELEKNTTATEDELNFLLNQYYLQLMEVDKIIKSTSADNLTMDDAYKLVDKLKSFKTKLEFSAKQGDIYNFYWRHKK